MSRPPGRPTSRAGVVIMCVILSGCGYSDSRMAHMAQHSLIGMGSENFLACAGSPSRSEKLGDGTEILQYEKNIMRVGADVMPIKKGGYCIAIIRLKSNKVSEIHYTGDDDDELIGTDGVCASILGGCIHE